MLQPKDYFIETLEENSVIRDNMKIIEFGSGQSRAMLPVIKKYPNVSYVGIEPSIASVQIARNLLAEFPNAKIYNQKAYNLPRDNREFDLCISLSVLEHVKQLEKFLINSINSVKVGGQIIHRYDLGHALHPSSCKERIQVFLGNYIPVILPENKFVRYVSEKYVRDILESNGARVDRVTYSQMPNHKEFLKVFETDSVAQDNLARKILEWEDQASPLLKDVEIYKRESLFPAVTVWATKIK